MDVVITVGKENFSVPYPPRRARFYFYKRCYTCKYPGHLMVNCPLRLCSSCLKSGHGSYDCPRR